MPGERSASFFQVTACLDPVKFTELARARMACALTSQERGAQRRCLQTEPYALGRPRAWSYLYQEKALPPELDSRDVTSGWRERGNPQAAWSLPLLTGYPH